jgi:hypothetical protein
VLKDVTTIGWWEITNAFNLRDLDSTEGLFEDYGVLGCDVLLD